MSDEEKKALTVKDVYEEQLSKLESDAAKVAQAIDPDKITALMVGEAARNPALYECVKTAPGRVSIVNFYMLSAQLGLEPGSAMGLLYAIPKKVKGDVCILPIIGYKGYCELAHRTGKIKRIAANPFYKGEMEGGSLRISKEPPDIQHSYDPSVNESDNNLAGAYALVETTDGGKYLLVLSINQIIERAKRGGSYGSSYSPWKTDRAAMARKTVLRALLSGGLVPLSTELRQALAEDGDSQYEQSNDAVDPDVQVSEPEVKVRKSGSDKLKDALNMKEDTVIDVPHEEVQDNPFDGPPTIL